MFFVILQIFCSLLILFLTSYLYFRVLVIECSIKKTFDHFTVYTELSTPLKYFILNALENDIFSEISMDGLKGIDLKYSDKTDTYHNLDDLLQWLVIFPKPEKLNQSDELIKGLYQLQYTLSLPTNSINTIINTVSSGLQNMKVLTDTITKVKIVNTGELVDRKTMIPLTYGPRVQQPLGVICFNSQGKVLNKAKVLCI